MAVIKDVAKLAGLSVATISKYLKKPNSVRKENKVRIEAAIRKLNYVPSTQARALRTGRSGIISIISPNITNPFFAELFSIIQDEATEKGYTAILQTISIIQGMGNSVASHPFAISSISQVDGMIVCFPDDEEVLPYLKNRWQHMPIILLSWSQDKKADVSILMDVKDGIYRVTKYLLSIGHRHIGYIGAPETSVTSIEKKEGFISAMNEQGVTIRPNLTYHGPYDPSTAYLATSSFFKSDFPPTAIITEADIFAIGCIKYCHHKNIKVPEQVAVTGFDDIPIASIYEPSITTMKIPIRQMGIQAVDTLFKLIFNEPFEKKVASSYKSDLIVRKSTDASYVEVI